MIMPLATQLSLLPISWPITIPRWSSCYLTVPTWLHMTFFCFSDWRERAERKALGVRGKHPKAITKFLTDIPVKEFEGAFQAWQTCLRKFIKAGKEYLKKF